MNKYDVFFYEAYAEEEQELRKILPPGINAGFAWQTVQESGHADAPALIISTRTQSVYPLRWAETLKAIISRSTGYDHLLSYKNKTHTKAALGWLPLYCHRAVAEQCLLLMLALMRKLSLQATQFAKFQRDGLTGSELQGKTLLIVGVGNIGYELALIGKALGMHVIGVDLVNRHADIQYESINEGMVAADIVSCNMNLTQENHGYFDLDRFAKGKRGRVFINTARGEMSPLDDIIMALQQGYLSGVALDAFEQEKELAVSLRGGNINDEVPAGVLQSIKKLQGMENVILTPHNSFNTKEALKRKVTQTIEQLEFFLQNGSLKWQI